MKIGIDFDNTIACYDSLFMEVALKERLIKDDSLSYNKKEIRNHFRLQKDGEKTWMKLQGLVYGKYMHNAEMMPGVANFLVSCKIQDCSVYIVSHKTKYGHYDPEKISLRGEALRWMESRRFFDTKHFALNKQDVYFADTREEKVDIISRLECDYFIDDLPEVFEEKSFPKSTKKILFGTFDINRISNSTILNSWRKISKIIFGKKTNNDLKAWLNLVLDSPIRYIKKIAGRGNSSVYKIKVSDEKYYALKYYPDRAQDKRYRLKTEFKALNLISSEHFNKVPKAIQKDDDLNIGVYEWIDGKNIKEPSFNDLGQSIEFIKQLNSLSKKKIKGIGHASEACLSANELIRQIEMRLFRLQDKRTSSDDLSKFLDSIFCPLWDKIKKESIIQWPIENRIKNLPKEKQTLSASDFGFHNCLKTVEGNIIFLDFDYFGWDDPVKVTADFIWHPAMNHSTEFINKWVLAMEDIFSIDSEYKIRLKAAMPLYGLRWALIILNEFLPEYAEKRIEANKSDEYNLENSKKIQLTKARRYCKNINTVTLKMET